MILILGGLDPSGGAGICADLRVAYHVGIHAFCVTTCVIPQNSSQVSNIFPLPIVAIRNSLDLIFADHSVEYVKIGAIYSSEIATFLADYLVAKGLSGKVILDTPLMSSSGHSLHDANLPEVLSGKLIPISLVVTPNLSEYNTYFQNTSGSFLIKSYNTTKTHVIDALMQGNQIIKTFENPIIEGDHSRRRGTGCALAAAIACNMCLSRDLYVSVHEGIRLVQTGILSAYTTGRVKVLNY